MKKNFFKKLSFVLASAMVLSSIAPAAGAFAASAPKLTAVKKYLHLDKDGYDEYDFNIKNKGKGWKYSWSSDNEDVATVDKLGVVTAEGVGSTKVRVLISDKDGEEIEELKATVTVRDNIESLTITNKPEGDKLAVGAENNFNRDFVTVSGDTEKTSGITRWVVTPAEGATINDSGIFVATKAGEYTITANSFQSKSKYESWLDDAAKYADYVTATVDYKVTVPNEIKAVGAVKSNQLKVEFASAVAAVNVADFALVDARTTAKQWIKSVSLSDDKSYAVVDLYNTLVSGSVYSLTAKVDGVDMKGEVNYVKGTPNKIVANLNQVAKADVAYTVQYSVVDENGLDITADTTVSFESSFGSIASNGQITLGDGVLEYVYVVYTNPLTAEQIKSERIAVTGISSTGTDLTTFTLDQGEDDTISWSPLKSSLNMNQTDFYLRFKYKNQYGNESTALWTDYVAGNVTFTSLDPQVVVVDAKSGKVTPVSTGTGSVRIEYGNINVIKTITIRSNPYTASLAANSSVFNVSDTGNHIRSLTNAEYADKLNTKTMKINFKNNYGETSYATPASDDLVVKVLTGNNIVTMDGVLLTAEGNATYSIKSNTDINLAAKSDLASNGTAVLKIYDANNESRYVTVTVNAYKHDDVERGFVIDGVKDLDAEQKFDDQNWTNDYTTTFKVYRTNSANFKVWEVTTASIEVKGPNYKNFTIDNATSGYALDITDTVADQNKDFAFNLGAYTVIARVNDTVVATGTFNVKDSGTKPSVVMNNNDAVGSFGLTQMNNQVSGLNGFSVVGFKFVAADSSKVTGAADSNGWYTDINISGSTSLYNVQVRVKKEISAGVERYYTISLGNMDARAN